MFTLTDDDLLIDDYGTKLKLLDNDTSLWEKCHYVIFEYLILEVWGQSVVSNIVNYSYFLKSDSNKYQLTLKVEDSSLR